MWLYSLYLKLARSECDMEMPLMSFWLGVEVIYGFVELFVHLGLLIGLQCCGKKMLKG